jgi:ABC-type transport system substrate-binding protein
VYFFVGGALLGAVAREVVEFYGDRIGDHPVGTGPFRLADWRRGSRIVLERNPTYREAVYDEHPADHDAARLETAARLKGRRLPLVDRVQISIIGESQPRWLSFLNGQLDVVELPPEFVDVATPNHSLAPHLAKRGIVMNRYPRTDVSVSYFAMEHTVVGGYEPHKVALRRAIALAVDIEREIRLVRHGQAIPAQSIIGPNVYGYDPAFKSEMSEHSLPRAKALLDVFGYVDRDGDGWREQPDGTALVLEYATQPDQQSRSLIELWKRNMDALGVRMEFRTASWPENLKASRAGKLTMWGVGWNVGVPDAENFLVLGYGRDMSSNQARFALAEFDDLFEAQQRMPESPERLQAIERAKRLLIAYMPYKVHGHRINSDLMHPWLVGYHGAHFRGLFWKYVDVDEETRAAADD